MKKTYMFIADEFEEVEAITPVDYLRRCGVEIVVVGVGDKTVRSARSVTLLCDCTLENMLPETASGKRLPDEMITQALAQKAAETALVILPGGIGNSRTLGSNRYVKQFVELTLQNGGFIAALCAAPALTFGAWGLLNGKRFTCYPGMGTDLPTQPVKDARVVQDGSIITACSAGAAEEFAFKLVELLCGGERVAELRAAVCAR